MELVSLTPRSLPPEERGPVITKYCAVWAPEQVLTLLKIKKITRPAGIRAPYRPTRAVTTGEYVFVIDWTQQTLGKVTELATLLNDATVTLYLHSPRLTE